MCSCSHCGEVFPKMESLELHQAVRHAGIFNISLCFFFFSEDIHASYIIIPFRNVI